MTMTDHHPDTPRNRGDSDAPHMSPVTPQEDFRTIVLNRVSWAAVLAGVVVSLVTQLLLNMLGLGLGLSTLDPGTGDNPAASTFSMLEPAACSKVFSPSRGTFRIAVRFRNGPFVSR